MVNVVRPSVSLSYANISETKQDRLWYGYYHDMLLATDNGQVTALCLLDFTAAFDTVDHELLMLRLERQFGIHDVALEWFRSYLQGRSFRVIYGQSTSATIHIVCSVPQGSVLGPRLFILYKADLAELV